MNALILIVFLAIASFVYGDQGPRLSFQTPVVPLGEEVSVIIIDRKVEQDLESFELRLTTLTGHGEARFSNNENRYFLQTRLAAVFSGIKASSQVNNIALSLYYEEELIDTVLLTVVNPELISFEEAIIATKKFMKEKTEAEGTVWRIPYHLPSAFFQEEHNRFVVTYPAYFNSFVNGSVIVGDRISQTFLVDAKTAEVIFFIKGSYGGMQR